MTPKYEAGEQASNGFLSDNAPFLLVAMLNTFGFDAGYRLILTGLIIISVIVVASGSKSIKR